MQKMSVGRVIACVHAVDELSQRGPGRARWRRAGDGVARPSPPAASRRGRRASSFRGSGRRRASPSRRRVCCSSSRRLMPPSTQPGSFVVQLRVMIDLELLEHLGHLDRRQEPAHRLLDAAIRIFDQVIERVGHVGRQRRCQGQLERGSRRIDVRRADRGVTSPLQKPEAVTTCSAAAPTTGSRFSEASEPARALGRHQDLREAGLAAPGTSSRPD